MNTIILYLFQKKSKLLTFVFPSSPLYFSGSFLDWLQNIDTRDSLIYKDNDNTTGEACETRKGYSQFLDTDLVPDARATLLACAGTCTDLEDCVVLTG